MQQIVQHFAQTLQTLRHKWKSLKDFLNEYLTQIVFTICICLFVSFAWKFSARMNEHIEKAKEEKSKTTYSVYCETQNGKVLFDGVVKEAYIYEGAVKTDKGTFTGQCSIVKIKEN